MAVRPDLRGYGLGAKVLGALMAHAECGSGTDVWCTARTSAAGFYESFGFVRNGVPEQVTGLGPHVFMSREVGSGHSE
jgi:predicted GNAT family N-acyltransferase